MSLQRPLAAAIVASLAAAPLAAQRAGTVELGGFGQFTRTDDAWHLNNAFGFGGRIGVFLHPRWELEFDASTASFDRDTGNPLGPGSTDGQTFAGRVTYNLPFGMGGRTHQFLLGVGFGGQRFDEHNDFSLSPGAGVRFMLADHVALRFDGLVEYVENPTGPTFSFPPTTGVNSQAARSTNVEIRAGISFLLGKMKESAPPPPPPPLQEAPPPRREEPPPQRQVEPPPPPDRSGIIRDSLAAVERAREALQAKIFFDFDRSELSATAQAALDAKLPVMQANPTVRIRIEGNADDRGSDEYNLALGMRRAQTARDYLVNHGIDASRIDIVSNGEEKATCQEQTESCWSQNRRDEFVIVAGGETLIAP